MKKITAAAKEFFRRADMFLLVMAILCAVFGIVVISSATASYGSPKYVIVQTASLFLGIFAFVMVELFHFVGGCCLSFPGLLIPFWSQ